MKNPWNNFNLIFICRVSFYECLLRIKIELFPEAPILLAIRALCSVSATVSLSLYDDKIIQFVYMFFNRKCLYSENQLFSFRHHSKGERIGGRILIVASNGGHNLKETSRFNGFFKSVVICMVPTHNVQGNTTEWSYTSKLTWCET